MVPDYGKGVCHKASLQSLCWFHPKQTRSPKGSNKFVQILNILAPKVVTLNPYRIQSNLVDAGSDCVDLGLQGISDNNLPIILKSGGQQKYSYILIYSWLCNRNNDDSMITDSLAKQGSQIIFMFCFCTYNIEKQSDG